MAGVCLILGKPHQAQLRFLSSLHHAKFSVTYFITPFFPHPSFSFHGSFSSLIPSTPSSFSFSIPNVTLVFLLRYPEHVVLLPHPKHVVLAHPKHTPRRPSRLAAQAQRSSAAESPLPVAQGRSLDPAGQFGLAGQAGLPISDMEDIAAAVHRHAEEGHSQLLEGSWTQETLIYYGATAAYIDAIRPADKDGIYPGRITFFGNESGLLFFRVPLPVHERARLFLFADIREWVSQWIERGMPQVQVHQDI
ncbi:hypothetical protein B0T25DRAFT_631525 [Lasiosphaeria hispida]|uniref:Uncharacterized protein n=1 Tax=Lasiosphaeria hispida TaxID=260671 RepID=A0AAJ0HHP3_9PEZI|nr:hypothetical protein B0T25DRAFT_631525 [Lasiosphaeria hispida]